MIPTVAIDLANLTLTADAQRAIGSSLETKLIVVRPDMKLGQIPREGMNLALEVTYSPTTDLPPSVVKLPIGMRERRNRTFTSKPPLTTVTIQVHVENYARS